MQKKILVMVTIAVALALISLVARITAEDACPPKSGADADLTQDLTNPVADLVAVPIQMN